MAECCIGNHPQILRFVDADEDVAPHYVVAVEKESFLQCSSVANALFMLFSVHYIFNMEYPVKVKDFYLFLEDKCFGIKEGGAAKTANYTNVLSLIECHMDMDHDE